MHMARARTASVRSGSAPISWPSSAPACAARAAMCLWHAGISGRPAHCECPLSSQLFHRCQRAVQALPSRARRACSEQEERLLRNVVASLAQALQELSTSFRHAQSGYLRRECPPAPGSWVTSVQCSGHGAALCLCPPLLVLCCVLCLGISSYRTGEKGAPPAPGGGHIQSEATPWGIDSPPITKQKRNLPVCQV